MNRHPIPVVTACADRRGRPFVSANFAMTWDGRVTTRNRTPSDFSSRTDKLHLIQLRGLADAVMAGRATAEIDAMSLSLPDPALRKARLARGQSAEPLRIIVSASGRIPGHLGPFARGGAPILICTTERIPAATRARLERCAEVRVAGQSAVDFKALLRELRRNRGIRHLHAEGGPTLLRALAEAGALDELHLTLCPLVFGGESAPTLTGLPGAFFPRSKRWRLVGCHPHGGECFLRYLSA
jgi:riboflavin-specific deaminase-like protein